MLPLLLGRKICVRQWLIHRPILVQFAEACPVSHYDGTVSRLYPELSTTFGDNGRPQKLDGVRNALRKNSGQNHAVGGTPPFERRNRSIPTRTAGRAQNAQPAA